MRANATHLKVLPGAPDPVTALESLFREHYDRVFRTAYRVTGSTVDAEDVLQTVFLRLARRGEELNLEPSPASYLHRAAINAALDLLRQRGRAESIPIDAVIGDLAANPNLNPETQQRDREMRRAVQQAVAQLGEKTAEMFVLRYFEGWDNREIAVALGTSPMVVAVMLHRARTKVKQQVGAFLEGAK